MHWRSEMQAEPMRLAGCWSRSPGLQRVTYGLRCGRGWEDHGKGDEGRSCINFSVINILPGGQPDEKSGFLVKGVEMVSAFRKNMYRNMKISGKGRKFQMLSIFLFFQEHLGFPLFEILSKNGGEGDIAQMFLLNCPRPSENGKKV